MRLELQAMRHLEDSRENTVDDETDNDGDENDEKESSELERRQSRPPCAAANA